MRISVIDYGSGNLRSVVKALDSVIQENELSGKVDLITSAAELRNADRIILPGVGAFADCRSGLDKIPDLVETLEERVIKDAAPFLGICVGMQLMAERGLEKQVTDGFGWLDGEVTPLVPKHGLKVPQMGWNILEPCDSHPQSSLLSNIPLGEEGLHAYFVHSYYFRTSPRNVIATTDYGDPIPAIVGRDNYIGTQFHPEKSQELGRLLLRNFLEWRP